ALDDATILAEIKYVSGEREGNENFPCPSVVAVGDVPPEPAAVTLAAAMTAPVPSMTLPLIAPVPAPSTLETMPLAASNVFLSISQAVHVPTSSIARPETGPPAKAFPEAASIL